MNKLVIVLLVMSSTANAVEVCKLISSYLPGQYGGCITQANCTNPKITVAESGVNMITPDSGMQRCDLSEAKAMKFLMEKGYQPAADGKTLFKY